MRTIQDIRRDWTGCKRCPLASYRHGVDGETCSPCSAAAGEDVRHHTVLGEGSPKADIMIIGEAPGEVEDSCGVPFIGPSGDVLTLFLNNTGLLRENLTEDQTHKLVDNRLSGDILRAARANLFITNLVGCRPEDNRDPTQAELHACWPRVVATIYTVDPLLIIALGRVAASYLLGESLSIQSQRGTLRSVPFPGLFGTYEIPVLLVLHPAFLMRNADKSPGGVWEKTHEDLRRALQVVQLAKRAYRGESLI